MKYICTYRMFFAVNVSISVFFLEGCKKFTNIDPPISQLVTASVFDNDGAAIAAQTSIYGQMSLASYSLSQNNGLLADELVDYSHFGINAQCYINAMNAVSFIGPWRDGYSYIHQENAILEGLQSQAGVRQTVKVQLEGEAKFMRAFWHFFLVNCYGEIPIVTSTDYVLNARSSRKPIAEVYGQIISDLKDATSMLSNNYLDRTDTATTKERVRPTKWASLSMLARAYLYNRQFDSAVIVASKVIENTTLYQLSSNLNRVFWKNSGEAIWQLAISLPTTRNTYDGYQYILRAKPTNVALNSLLLASFESGDQRRKNWIRSFVTAANDSFYYPYKYKVWTATSTAPDSSEYVMVLRLAEQYLIRAEARAQNGDFSGAIDDLNVIRTRAGLSNYSGSSDKSSILAAILHERQVELFTEWGHRWFDLIRTNNINLVMGAPGNVCHYKGGVWKNDNHQALYPIWQSEMGIDPHLTQNPGY